MHFNIIRSLTLLAGLNLFSACNQGAEQQKTANQTTLFTLLPSEKTNISFQNNLTEALNTNILMYEYFYNGGGVAAGDFNNDGLVDLYFTANMSENKLYLNRGNLQFTDITISSGTTGRPGPWKTGANAVDINADGKLDIYLCYSGALPAAKRTNQLFINAGNDGQGIPRFEEQAEAFGLANTGFSNHSYFFDYDRDGDLDLLLLNHNPKNLPLLNEEATAALFKQDSPEKGLRLFKQTNGKFTDVTTGSGINGSELSYGLGLGISDFNNDGWPDFYVSNDYSVPDYLYMNNSNGTFTNKLEQHIAHTSQFSMGNDVADISNDGWPDIYTLDMLPEDNRRQKLLLAPDNYEKFNLNLRSGFYYQYMRNMLHVNNGNGSFSETGQLSGVSNTDWSWSALIADYDNDGWKDLHVTNGYLRDYTNLDFINYMNNYVSEKGRLQREDVMQIIQKMPSSNVNNYIFKNQQGTGFTNKTAEWGLQYSSNSNGAAYADLDNDGDLDLVVNNINQPAFVFKNEARQQTKNNYLQLQLKGLAGNTQGLGARIKIFYQGLSQLIEQHPARGYLSTVSYNPHFGVGNAAKVDSLTITWISGNVQTLYDINSNQLLILNEKDATPHVLPATLSPGWFTEITPQIQYTDAPNSINDFNRQPLLISEKSHTSPCLLTADLNNDQLDDMIIGGAAGQVTRVLLQQKNGGFLPAPATGFHADTAFSVSAIEVLDANVDGKPDIYLASGGYHRLNQQDSLLQDRLYLSTGKNNYTRSSGLPKLDGSKACVKSQDINDDGFPDLFVGGSVIPGRYPDPPKSYILINDGKGNFSDQTENICPEIARAGMVTDAVWVDLDLDKKNELVIAGEWMPIKVYKIENRKLVTTSDQFFDKTYSGWWNKIAVGDFNNDLKPDLMVGNMGLNTAFNVSDNEPLEMYYDDFDENGSIDPIFSFYVQHKRYPYLTRDELLNQLPSFRKRFPDFKSYADVTLDELFEPNQLKAAKHLVANHMETTCFLSTAGRKFVTAQLPKEVQYSPVNTIVLMDFNKDGNTDLLLGGNNSYTKIRLGKFDANYGTLLEGDGKGHFSYVTQRASGFNIRGDVRSCITINETIYFGIHGKSLVAYKPAIRKK